jgi:hypothetical protein
LAPHRVLLRVSGRHIGIAAIQEGVGHVGFKDGGDLPLDKVVHIAIAPDATQSNTALAVLMFL